MCNEAVTVYCKIFSRHLCGETEEHHDERQFRQPVYWPRNEP
jgi:hypothetical protein